MSSSKWYGWGMFMSYILLEEACQWSQALEIHSLTLILVCYLCIMLVCKDVITQLTASAFFSAACFLAMMASYLSRTVVTVNRFRTILFCHGKRKVMNM